MRHSTARLPRLSQISPSLVLHTSPRAGPWRARTAILIAVVALVRLFIIATTGLTDTEAYYAAWARFPAWSYYDHPPMVAWMVRLTTLLGTSDFSIRVGALFCAAALAMLLFHATSRMFSPRAGFFAALLVNALPVFWVVGFLANPESALLPVWALFLFLLYEMRAAREAWRPLALGAVVGLAFLCKYTGVLAVPVTVLYLATSRRTRDWLARPSFYLGGVVALAIASPVVAWNYQHGWPSLQLHLVERMAASGSGVFLHNAAHIALTQWLYLHPLMLPGLLAAMAMVVARARGDERFRLLAWASVPVLAFFLAIMIRAKDAEPHWTMVAYLPLIIGAAAYLDEAIDSAGARLRLYVRASLSVSALAATLYLVHIQSDVLVRLIPAAAYDAASDPFNETQGWRELRAAVAEQAAALGPETVVVSDHNVLCGHVAIALADTPPVYCVSPTRTAFDFVGRRDVPKGAPVVYVDSARYSESPDTLLAGYHCADVRHVQAQRGGKVVQDFRLAACAPMDTPGPSDGDQTAAVGTGTY